MRPGCREVAPSDGLAAAQSARFRFKIHLPFLLIGFIIQDMAAEFGKIDKKLIIGGAVAVALLLLVIFGTDFLREIFGTRTVLAPPADLKIDTYSLGGKVVEVGSDKIVFEAGMVFINAKGENVFDYTKKTALVSAETKIHRVGDASVLLQLSDIQPGVEITIYTSQNPSDSNQFPAERIEVK